jgi:hypothetical protein
VTLTASLLVDDVENIEKLRVEFGCIAGAEIAQKVIDLLEGGFQVLAVLPVGDSQAFAGVRVVEAELTLCARTRSWRAGKNPDQQG